MADRGAAFIGSAFCALVPISGHLLGYQGVVACRVITGSPKEALFFRWSPGYCDILPIAGFISSSAVGWPVVFTCTEP
nr:unnamed protein product [Callosobruchus analis]